MLSYLKIIDNDDDAVFEQRVLNRLEKTIEQVGERLSSS